MFFHATLALKQLWGNKDYSRAIEEMLEEKAALQSVRSYSVLELIQNKTIRWQLITVAVTFTSVQLCGINAVSVYARKRGVFLSPVSVISCFRLCSFKKSRNV